MMNKLLSIALFLLFGSILSIGLISCTSDSGGFANYDEGGIDGSGVTGGSGGGEVTGFGSVIFSDSEFSTNASTAFTLDGVDIVEGDLRIGMVAQFAIGTDASNDLASGTALRIDAESVVKGVVTGINPLKVLGQTVVATNNTVLDNLPGGLPLVALGDVLTIYGFANENNVIQATRVQRNTAGAASVLTEWKLTGKASLITLTSLNIGDQAVEITGVDPENCGVGIQAGDQVSIVSQPNMLAGFSELKLVNSIECDENMILVPANPEAVVIPAEFEGLISGYTLGVADTEFLVGGQTVDIALTGLNATTFSVGSVGGLLDGVRVEVEGTFDTGSSRLQATEVIFKQAQVELLAPVDPVNINLANETFAIMGITTRITAATSDEVNILSGGLIALKQLSVHGFVNGSEIIATEIRDEGVPKFDEVKLQGGVSNEIAGTSIEILDVLVTVNAGTSYQGDENQPLTVTEFFNAIANGSLVEVSGMLSIVGPPSIVADEIEVVD